MKEIPQEVGFNRDDLKKVGSLCASFNKTRKIETFREAAELLHRMGKTASLDLSVFHHVMQMWTARRTLSRILLMKELGLKTGLVVKVDGIPGTVTGMTSNYYVQIRLQRENRPYVSVLPENLTVPGFLVCRTCRHAFTTCLDSTPDQAHDCSVDVKEEKGRLLATGHYGSSKFDGMEIDLTDSTFRPMIGVNCDSCIEKSIKKGGKVLSETF